MSHEVPTEPTQSLGYRSPRNTLIIFATYVVMFASFIGAVSWYFGEPGGFYLLIVLIVGLATASCQRYAERGAKPFRPLLAWAIGLFLGFYASFEIGHEVDSSWHEMAAVGFVSGLALNAANMLLNKMLRHVLTPVYQSTR